MTLRGGEALYEMGGGCYTVGVSEGQFLNKLTLAHSASSRRGAGVLQAAGSCLERGGNWGAA
jgi:hypothetical protein